jgi:hypothetical protein
VDRDAVEGNISSDEDYSSDSTDDEQSDVEEERNEASPLTLA